MAFYGDMTGSMRTLGKTAIPTSTGAGAGSYAEVEQGLATIDFVATSGRRFSRVRVAQVELNQRFGGRANTK